MRRKAWILLAILMAAACGKKGPLEVPPGGAQDARVDGPCEQQLALLGSQACRRGSLRQVAARPVQAPPTEAFGLAYGLQEIKPCFLSLGL